MMTSGIAAALQGDAEPGRVRVTSVTPLDSRTALLQWAVGPGKPPRRFYLQVRNLSTGADWLDVDDHIPPNATSYTVRYLAPAMTYGFQLAPIGDTAGPWAARNITMPPDVPPQVSWVHLMATTNETLLFGWRRPSHDNGSPITRYAVQLARGADVANETLPVQPSANRNNLMYIFVSLEPGSPYRFKVQACSGLGCGEWSEVLEATTSDGMSDPPEDVEMRCFHDFQQNLNYAVVTWELPTNIRGTLLGFNVTLEGVATFRGLDGKSTTDVTREHGGATRGFAKEFKSTLRANTNYTTRVCAVNRAGCGNASPITEKTACMSPPTVPSSLPPFELKRDDTCAMLHLKLSRVSERNGPIRCYRVVLIRLRRGDDLSSLPPDPIGLNLATHPEVHVEEGYGAYLAESFASEEFTAELVLGNGAFPLCDPEAENGTVYDGPLLPLSNYTGFVEVQVWGPNGTIMTKQSSYFSPIQAGCVGSTPSAVGPQENPLAFIVGVVCGVLAVLLILLLVLCLIRRKTGHPADGTPEQLGLAAFIKKSKANHLPAGPHKTLHMGPIPVEDLATAYLERHIDHDLLFTQEFESLPDTFRGRTTEAAELPENWSKNRHPEVKPYDQTRVNLAPIEGVVGSDYINASLVEEEKQVYICAQGPLESTVADFWRMVWEQGVTVVAMLTGVEEQGEIKCYPYWSDDGAVDVEKLFRVSVMTSRRYCDYLVRRIELENLKLGERRDILHFQYLVWTDLISLDAPHWLLRYLKRINEHYCPSRGPLLVHSSCGVGRTGTFVALDCLLRQMRDQSQADIFMTVCRLRKSRARLVNSLRQYIFLYRALMEQSLFGDSEVLADHLRDHYLHLQTKGSADGFRRFIDQEFDRLSEITRDPRPCSEAKSEIHKHKNRYDFILPTDVNRVVLPQIPAREFSTYINASYVQGYDRALLFIVTQDPLESTLGDFWRMVHDQAVATIVMLSELGNELYHCTRYWPEEGEEQTCDDVQVLLLSVESWPHFTVRKFSVNHLQNKSCRVVSHFQYLSWPGPFGSVPEGPSGLLQLMNRATLHQEMQSGAGPMLVHCSGGGDRSGVYVTLSSLVKQLRTEDRVDVFQAARFTRSQRDCTIQTLSQYDFLYRGLLEHLASHKIYDMGDTAL